MINRIIYKFRNPFIRLNAWPKGQDWHAMIYELICIRKQHELPEMAHPSIINTYHEVKSIQKHFSEP